MTLPGPIHILGGGLAGSEAAWQVARRGLRAILYEMRFDEASAKFAEFGPFYTGLQFASGQLPAFLGGTVPTL